MPQPMKRTDVSIVGSNGFFVFVLHTQRAKRWTADNVNIGIRLTVESFPCDDTRLARDIAEAMRAEGLEVR